LSTFGVFEWSDFLDLAEDLAALPDHDAAARTAISRAYYATFHAGRDYLDRAHIPVDRGRNAHFQVQTELQKRSTEIGLEIALLHSWRKQADHDTQSIPNAETLARSAVSLARETISAIEVLA